jgi:hypothetical protein
MVTFLLKCHVYGYCNMFCFTVTGFGLQYLFWVTLRILRYNNLVWVTVPRFRLVYGNTFWLQYILWVTLHIQGYNNLVWVTVPCFRLAYGNTFSVMLTRFGVTIHVTGYFTYSRGGIMCFGLLYFVLC